MSEPQHSTLAAAAAAFATRAHEGQKRTGTQFPYVTHPLGVGHLLRQYYPEKPELEAAGYLHDVVEDTKVRPHEIERRFGTRVAILVDAVTSRRDDEHRVAVRMSLDPDVARLKAADVLDNVRDSIRGLEKGHDVWSRFRAGRGKLQYWQMLSGVASVAIVGEPLAADLRAAVERVAEL